MKHKKIYVSFILAFIMIFSIFTVSCSENGAEDESKDNNTTNTNGENVSVTSDGESGNVSEEVSKTPSDDTSSEETIPEDKRVHFVACPDNIIHTSLMYDAIDYAAKLNGKEPDSSDLHNAEYDFSYIYTDVKDMIKNADISYLNQETLIGGTYGDIGGWPYFNSPQAVADEDIELGFDVINVAHNHMLDSFEYINGKRYPCVNYLKHCSEMFMDKGVTVIGYYPDEESTNIIPVIEKNGIKIAFLSYTYGTNNHVLPEDSPFVIPYFSKELVTKQVKLAKQISDFIIVSCHWGHENTYKQNSMQKEYAQLLTDLEVDVALGMHSHSIQPIEWQVKENGHRTLVIYSLGNFVSGMEQAINMLGLIMQFDIVKDGVTNEVRLENVEAVPIVTHINKRFRGFHIYYLSDYTEELAKVHRVNSYESAHGSTLIGGKFSKENLVNTLTTVIDSEFLPEEFKNLNPAEESSK